MRRRRRRWRRSKKIHKTKRDTNVLKSKQRICSSSSGARRTANFANVCSDSDFYLFGWFTIFHVANGPTMAHFINWEIVCEVNYAHICDVRRKNKR